MCFLRQGLGWSANCSCFTSLLGGQCFLRLSGGFCSCFLATLESWGFSERGFSSYGVVCFYGCVFSEYRAHIGPAEVLWYRCGATLQAGPTHVLHMICTRAILITGV